MPAAVSAPPAAVPAAAESAADRPVPTAFLFRFELDLPQAGEAELEPPFDLPESARLPQFAALDGAAAFATVQIGWTPAGLAVRCDVEGKERRPEAAAKAVADGEGLHLWIDTRPSGSAHRAGRYCKRFALLPRVGRSGKPGVYDVPIMQQGQASVAEPLAVPLDADVTKGGYRIAAFLPAEQLPGFDPSRSRTIALHTVVVDSELGDQPLTVGSAFPTAHDPSLWTRAKLAG